MSFIKIDNNNFEQVTLNLRPSVTFYSSSIDGSVSGSEYVAPVRSKCFKDMSIEIEDSMRRVTSQPLSYSSLSSHLDVVNQENNIAKFNKTIDIFRFDQPAEYNQNKNIKNIIKNNLMPYYQGRYDNCNYAYSNYHSLNFFNSDTVPTGSALIYPNVIGSDGSTGVYDLPEEFSLNFWINPRYSFSDVYNTGTIFHLSSSLCVSIVSGSSRNEYNEVDKFKIMIQLSQSADIKPSRIDLNNIPANELIFTSSHFLEKNNWHNVCIQWGALFNNSTGSIFIDELQTNFAVDESSVSTTGLLSPPGLVVGNFYEGTNNNLAYMLNNDTGYNEGFTGIIDASAGTPIIDSETFSQPLNAEIHEIKLFDKVLNTYRREGRPSEKDIASSTGAENFNNLKFYLPPHFYPTTAEREVLVTPFQKIRGTTDDPINVSFSLGLGGKLINLENFTREFIVGQTPRHFNLVPETINTTVQDITVDEFIYHTGSHKKRNMTIMPNDNGLFSPRYFTLSQFSGDQLEINLDNLIPEEVLYNGLVQQTGSFYDSIIDSIKASPGVFEGAEMIVAQRTRDLSSNEIVIYDISNIYYGNRINPESFEINDFDLTGSDGKIQIKIKDNGRGSLYRADSLTPHAKWNSVGSIFYDEGIVIVKSPHLMYLNKNETNISLKGEQNIHTMILNIPAYKSLFNSSSNPTFKDNPPTNNVNDEDLSTVYVTSVNIHDDNFNIIMKANFAQPITKTEADEFIIRLKEDF